MVDKPTPSGQANDTTASTKASNVKSTKANPAFRALGMPNFRLRLPSRNWMIFLTITGTWTGALFYDRQQTKKIQRKWCDLVAHVSHDIVPTSSLTRKVTIFLSAPPGDGIRSAREHFTDYVKPVLVAAAMDWDVVEGRRQGEIRAGLAKKIRRQRKLSGETSTELEEDDNSYRLEQLRQRNGVQDWPGPKGDIVIGRHTWKEYLRGLHEGWLGPLEARLDSPLNPAGMNEVEPQSDVTADSPQALQELEAPNNIGFQESTSDAQTLATESVEKEKAAKVQTEAVPSDTGETKTPSRPAISPPYILPPSYQDSLLPSTIPEQFYATGPIAFPHILGFFNTPIRMYRFINRRKMADDIGRQTAAAVLAAHRAFHGPSSQFPESDSLQSGWEQASVLESEESEWHKKSLAPKSDVDQPWVEDIVMDERIASRMRVFELTAADEERARRIGDGSAGIPGT